MKKLVLILVLFYVSGCASFGKGVAEAILENESKADTRRCEIKGQPFQGLDAYLNDGNTVKVLMIHGVGTHQPGYSARLRENLAKMLNLTVFSKRPKNITLVFPKDNKTVIGNLRVTRMQSADKNRDLLFYELTWSDITAAQKKMLGYDVSGEYVHKRAAFNNTLKRFLDDTVPDPMIYVLDDDGPILGATQQSTCWMLSKSWDQLSDHQKGVCRVSSYQEIKDLNHQKIVYITHSLGSRIIMDSLSDMVNHIAAAEAEGGREAQLIINELKNKELTVFMMANQLPLLQIREKRPKVHNQIRAYCQKKGPKYDRRIFKQTNIIAFSDPNDLLSYDIEQGFVDDYFDSRICPELTNVQLNVAEEISAFGVGVVNPVAAHTLYDNDERVIEMIAKGNTDFKNNPLLSKRCQYYKLEN